MKELLERIRQRTAKIAVVGLGYVGLPLAVNFAKQGFKVLGLDTSQGRVRRIRDGKNYNEDVSLRDIAQQIRRKNLWVSTDLHLLSRADVILICVPTPLKRKYTPDISYIVSAVKTIQKHLQKGSLVVLESTTYPGTTEELICPILEEGGRKAEKDFYLAFSPERIDPGNKQYPVTRIPKIVGGLSPASAKLAQALYRSIIRQVFVVSSARAAEMTKLLENSFRFVNIGWINEAAMVCHKMKINIWEVIEAAKTKPFGFMPFYPSLGVGGHCIPDDPLYLFWKARHHGISSKFIKLSADINHKIPEYVFERLESLLAERGVDLRAPRVLVLGVTYKKDVKDLRRSAAVQFLEVLRRRGYRAAYYDPLIPYLKIGGLDMRSIKWQQGGLRDFDAVVIAVAHSRLDYLKVLKGSRLVFDLCNVYHGKKSDHLAVL